MSAELGWHPAVGHRYRVSTHDHSAAMRAWRAELLAPPTRTTLGPACTAKGSGRVTAHSRPDMGFMGYSGCSRQSNKLPSPMWDRQSPPRAHTRIRLSHRLPCDHYACCWISVCAAVAAACLACSTSVGCQVQIDNLKPWEVVSVGKDLIAMQPRGEQPHLIPADEAYAALQALLQTAAAKRLTRALVARLLAAATAEASSEVAALLLKELPQLRGVVGGSSQQPPPQQPQQPAFLQRLLAAVGRAAAASGAAASTHNERRGSSTAVV
jgi:hypothetical protein